MTPIESGAAHLWFLDTGSLEETATASRWLACLEEHERMRYSAYGSAAARSEYLGTRALVRTALAHYSGQSAESLCFRNDRHEKPELTSPAMPRLRFSLANTMRLAVGLFALDLEVGVDVELVAPIEALEVAEGFFSPSERAELATLEDAARLSRFYELWTLREAYLKARGVGLTLPLDQLAFRPSPAGSAQAEFGPAIGDDPARWQFGLAWLTVRQLVATCVEVRSSGPTPILRFDAGDRVLESTRPLTA